MILDVFFFLFTFPKNLGRSGEEERDIYGDGLSVKFCRGVLNSQYTFAKISENEICFLFFDFPLPQNFFLYR